jgi:peptide/nickel transport system permease protein
MAISVDIAAPGEVAHRDPPNVMRWLRAIASFCRKKPLGALGGLIVIAMIFVTLFVDTAIIGGHTPLLAPDGYNVQHISRADINQGMSWAHPFGTDQLGRDILSRVMYGIRISTVIGLGGVLFASLISLLLGTVSGYFSGWTDTIIQRFVDAVLAIPALILVIYVIIVFAARAGPYPRMFWITAIIGFIVGMGATRVVRGAAISAAQEQYVDAARALGATKMRIVLRHIMPNMMPIVIVLATINVGTFVLAEAAISFLGYGVPSPFPSLGGMLSIAGSSQFRAHPEQAIWPGLAIFLLVFGFNMFGDALRDIVDPRMRGGR